MSTEKGEALVRSPPGLVESLGTHVGGSSKWGEPQAPHMPPQKQQQAQRNATVTKISSGSYIKNHVTITPPESKKRAEIQQDAEVCGCAGWARARQLEHDLDQLKKTHDFILEGLHHQLEDMKKKNRDLTFQLLMGPFASSVLVDAPLSPESDITPPKEGPRKEQQPSAPLEIQETSTQPDSKAQSLLSETSYTDARRNSLRKPKSRSNDPRLARSLDLEILEEEADEMRVQLEDERARNKYLVALTEELKNQLRQETGTWYPQMLTSKRASHPATFKQFQNARKHHVIEPGMQMGAFRLPQIPYQSRQILPIDQELALHKGHQSHQMKYLPDSLRNNHIPKGYERVKDGMPTTLPAIVQIAESEIKRNTEGQEKLEKRGESDSKEMSSSRDKFPLKGKTKHRNHSKDKIQESSGLSSERQQPHRNSQTSHKSTQQKSKGEAQPLRSEQRTRHAEDKQPRGRDSRKPQGETVHLHNSPKKHRSGSSSRVRNTLQQTPDPLSKINRTVSPSSRSVRSNPRSNGSQSLIPDGKLSSKQKHGEAGGEAVGESSKCLNGDIANSSGSLGSLASTSTRSKHRGRTNKRGGKKNKKEIEDTKDGLRDH